MSGRAEQKCPGIENRMKKKGANGNKTHFYVVFQNTFFDFVLGFDFSKCFLGLRVF